MEGSLIYKLQYNIHLFSVINFGMVYLNTSFIIDVTYKKKKSIN